MTEKSAPGCAFFLLCIFSALIVSPHIILLPVGNVGHCLSPRILMFAIDSASRKISIRLPRCSMMPGDGADGLVQRDPGVAVAPGIFTRKIPAYVDGHSAEA